MGKEALEWITNDKGDMVYLINPKFLKLNGKRVLPKKRSEKKETK